MSDAIRIGPLLLPLAVLLVFASAGSTLALGKWLSRGGATDAEPALWRTLLVGVFVARLAFVVEYRALYLDSPLSILDIRDGGWNAIFGLVAAWLYALHHMRTTPDIRKPLRLALGAGTALFVAGTAIIAFRPSSGQEMPDLAFTSLEGRTVPLQQFKGKPTVVNLWATWCPPCVREMPVLHDAQVKHPEINFVFLNQGEGSGQVGKWLESQRLPLRNVLLDPDRQASAAFNQKGYPTTLFFDAQGERVSVRIGELSTATLTERLEMLNP